MQCSILPPKIIKCVDKLNQYFLWGSTENKKKIHMVNWKKVTKPKKDGALGLEAAKEKNTTLLAKLNWRMHHEKESLWTRVLTHKYINHRRSFGFQTSVGRIKGYSTVWKGIKEGEFVFKKGTK